MLRANSFIETVEDEFGYVQNIEREKWEIERALKSVDKLNQTDDFAEFLKDVIITGELEWKEKVGIDKALKKLQKEGI